jgi:hypothetical protein
VNTLQLEFAFDIHINVQPGSGLEVGAIAKGTRRMIPITGGTFEGPNIRGKVMSGGYDFQLLRFDGVTEIDARYVLQTDDGAIITILNQGLRHGPAAVMQQLSSGTAVDPSLYYFRSIPAFETASEKYNWITRSVFVANGVRKPAEVIISVFKIL